MPARLQLAAKFALILACSASIAPAQNPNNGGGGGPGGGWGGGGRGGPGGGWPGGPGGQGGQGGSPSSPARLLQAEPVQEELKLTEKQKAQIKTLAEAATKKRTTVRDQAQKAAEANFTAAQANAKAEAAAVAEANGIDPTAAAAAANNGNGNGNNGNGNNGGRGGRGGNNGPGNDPSVRQAVRETLDALQANIDAAFLKLVDRKQQARVKQIGVQVEGVQAFLQPETISKLVLEDQQVADIRAVLGESRTAQRDLGRQMRTTLADLAAKKAATTPAAGAPEAATPAKVATPAPAPGNGNANNGNNGRNGGPGGPGGRPNFDPALFATPEFQAAAEKMDQARKKLNSQALSTVLNKVLTRPQRGSYAKMTGEPFDVSKLNPGPGGWRPPGAPGAQASAATPAAAGAATAAPTPAPAATPAAKATAPARKSLRELRGGAPQ